MYGLLVIAYKLLEKCCNYISTDNALNQQRVKALTNNLISVIKPVINKFDGLIAQTQEMDVYEDQVTTRTQCIEIMNNIFQDNPLKVFDLHTILRNLADGKRVYTQVEYDKKV